MKSIYINPNTGDFEFDGQKRLKMISDDEEIMQGIWMIITTNVGEWFLNDQFGFARFRILGQKFDEADAVDELNAAILQHDKIAAVEDVVLDYNRTTRKLKINYVCRKENGEIIEGAGII